MRLTGGAREYQLHQWANDWLSIDPGVSPHEPRDDKGRLKPGIVAPGQVVLDTEECQRLREDYERALTQQEAGETPSSGLFWKAWSLRTTKTGPAQEVGVLIARHHAMRA